MAWPFWMNWVAAQYMPRDLVRPSRDWKNPHTLKKESQLQAYQLRRKSANRNVASLPRATVSRTGTREWQPAVGGRIACRAIFRALPLVWNSRFWHTRKPLCVQEIDWPFLLKTKSLARLLVNCDPRRSRLSSSTREMQVSSLLNGDEL